MAATKERPIIFSGPMVCAILDGRKTVTRRIVKGADAYVVGYPYKTGKECGEPVACTLVHDANGRHLVALGCPYGQPGDRLWCKETYALHRIHESSRPSAVLPTLLRDCWYRADGEQEEPLRGRWRPSIHMPRWASRLTLEVVSVRVERLHDITEEDAKAEGFACLTKDGGRTWKYGIPDRDGLPGTDNLGWRWTEWEVSPRVAFCRLWMAINGESSWAANPWVWRVEFRKVEGR